MKQWTNSVLVLALSVMGLQGCASTPYTPEGLTKHHIKLAQKASKSSDAVGVWINIAEALEQRQSPAVLSKFINSEPLLRDQLVQGANAQTDSLTSVYAAVNHSTHLQLLRDSALLDTAAVVALFERLENKVLSSTLSGELKFVLDQYDDRFASLQSPGARDKVFENTIAILKTEWSDRPIDGLMAYVQGKGAGSAEWLRVKEQLPLLNIRATEVAVVARAYPDYAEERRATMTAKVHLTAGEADRIFVHDLKAALGRLLPGVSWTDDASEAAIQLDVERVRHEERQLQEQTQTITYARHQVNLIGAALLMPQTPLTSTTTSRAGQALTTAT